MKFFFFLLVCWSLEASSLHLATSSNPARLNPILATDSSSSEIAGFLFNGLVKFDKDSKIIIGDLAEKFYFKDDKTLVFELRHNVLWHDGAHFTSKDVLFTYQTLISDKISSPYSAGFRFVESVKIVDKYTVEVKVSEIVAHHFDATSDKSEYRYILRDEENMMSSSFNTAPIGTGAYKLEQLEFSKNIILAAFDEYFLGRAKIDKISFHVIGDPMTRFLMLKSGQLDLGSIEPMAYERQLHDDFFTKFNIYEKISLSYTYLGFNLRLKKFQDARVRQALSLAIDRQELIDILYFKHAKVFRN